MKGSLPGFVLVAVLLAAGCGSPKEAPPAPAPEQPVSANPPPVAAPSTSTTLKATPSPPAPVSPAVPGKNVRVPALMPGKPGKVGPKQLPAAHIVTGLEGKWTDQNGRVYVFGPEHRVEWHMPLPSGKGAAIYTGIYTLIQNRMTVVPEAVKATNPSEDSKLKASLSTHRAASYLLAKQPDGSIYLAGPGGTLRLTRA